MPKDILEDVLVDLSYAAGVHGFDMEDSHQRREQLTAWGHEFVRKHRHTDWETADFLAELDTFIDQKLSDYPAKPLATVYVLSVADSYPAKDADTTETNA